MTGPVREHTAGFVDLHRRELVIVAPLVAFLLGLGFFPKPVLDVIDEGVGAHLAEVGVSDPSPEVDATTTAEGTAQ